MQPGKLLLPICQTTRLHILRQQSLYFNMLADIFPTLPRRVLGPTQRALSPGVQRPGHEADHSPPTSADVKNTWIYTSTPFHTSSWRSA
jgi:hypothetical protein